MRVRYPFLILLAVLAFALPNAALVLANEHGDTDEITALGAREKGRLRQLGALAVDAPDGQPFRRVDGALGVASVVLPSRVLPYTLRELATTFPASIETLPNGIVLVKDDLVVGEGAELRISSSYVREVRLLSSADRFVTITSWRGTITIAGTRQDRLRIVSWDSSLNAPDEILSDGRAWLHTRRGTMAIEWATLEYLGFLTGSLSGVTWEGRPDDPARGNVTGSVFQYNYIGAHTSEAIEMQWRLNAFAYNIDHGLAPRDHSDHFLVESNRAYGNGGDGISFSRGSTFNVVRDNGSFDNGMHGIVLDDGPDLNSDGTLRADQGIPSDDNLITANLVVGNQVGIALDRGTRNTISANTLGENETGVRLNAVGVNAVTGNRIRDNVKYGILLENGANANAITDNEVSGGTAGIMIRESTGNQIQRNVLRRMSETGIGFVGNVSGTYISDNKISEVQTGIDLKRATNTDNVTRRGNDNQDVASQAPDDSSIRGPITRWAFWGAILAIPVLLGPWYGRLLAGLRSARVSFPRTK